MGYKPRAIQSKILQMIKQYANRIADETFWLTEVFSPWHMKVADDKSVVNVWVNKRRQFTIMIDGVYKKKWRAYNYESLINKLGTLLIHYNYLK